MAELILTIPASPAGARAIAHLQARTPELGGMYRGSLPAAVDGLEAARFLAELPFSFHRVATEDGEEAAVANRIAAWHSGEREDVSHGRVDGVELNVPLHPLAPLGLPFHPAHHHAGYLAQLRVPDAHALGVRGAGVRVAILDSGLDPTAQVAVRDAFDVVHPAPLHPGPGGVVDHDGHGTAMAQLVQDVAPDAELYVVRVLDAGRLNLWMLLAGVGVALADCHADVVNLSLGFGTLLSCGLCGGAAAVRSLAFERLTAVAPPGTGTLPVYVAAVGNAASTVGFEFPAASPTCVAVGAVDSAGVRSAFSNYGTTHARYLMAPGGQQHAAAAAAAFTEDVGVSATGVACAGTSVATAYASGMLALFRSEARYAGMARDVFVDAVLPVHCARPAHAAADTSRYGHGVIAYTAPGVGGPGSPAVAAPAWDRVEARDMALDHDVYVGGLRRKLLRGLGLPRRDAGSGKGD